MRNYLEERLDDSWKEIREYIVSIKDFTKEALLEEVYKQHKETYDRGNEFSKKYGNSFYYEHPYWNKPEWIKDFKDYRANESNISLIAMSVEEKFYLFTDKDEHLVNMQLVDAVVGEGPVFYHRWHNTEFK